MPSKLIPSFLFYCFVNGITPGPANLLSLSSAITYGRKQALKQWRGLFTGFAIDSLAAVFLSYFLGSVLGPFVHKLAFVGAAYLLWMAWHLWKSSGSDDEGNAAKNCNFMTGLLCNLTNVKVILFCITALGSFVLPYSQSLGSLLAAGIFLPFTGPICNLAWLFAGDRLRVLFKEHRTVVNAVMALSLVFCAISLVLSS